MQSLLSRRALGRSAVAVVGTFGILRHARGETALKIRCSLDTAPSHVRNVSIVDYLGKVKDATGGQIDSEVFHSGQLYPDLQVAKALLQGQVDMACPGLWTQTGIVPDCDFCQLPVFYGRPVEATEKASDGAAGKIVNGQIESKLRVKVLGPYVDLGFQNWYTTKVPLRTSADIKGLKIRSPGGAGISWRISFFGGIPNTTAWPNVPLALSQGTFDGFVSTNESVATAKLWEAGVKYSYQDRQYVGQYMPMISHTFWSKLTPDVQKIMLDLWASNISTYRHNAAQKQTEARKTMEANGVQFTDPSDEVIAAARKAMQADVNTLIKDAKLSPDVVKAAETSVNGTA
ncbi:MAG TPA: TRAP transporter substrate-binding protein DctP [Rhodopila sp.]|uniref:TRAP transporter substrate-binding protein DctP n=1 Tax=Rhodopila sp. TaxID=2480087 RepID=UPI002C992B86|nr:TRAP transporter substrate-binding protein DctP [Rhodopila sp.]HVY13904.1 TRAP transporter substrate-binding protein DctP [Rhodopila sp.]